MLFLASIFWQSHVACKYIGVDILGQPTLRANIEHHLPFKNNTFDLVFAGEIIEHVVDTDLFLDECKRILKKNGYLLLTTPNLSSWINRIRLLLGRQPFYCENRLRIGIDAGHVRNYVPRELRKQLLEHRFNVKFFTGDIIQGKLVPDGFKIFLAATLSEFAHCTIALSQKY